MTTVDQYYDTDVEQILTTVTERLTSDTSARFVWSETKWLSMWWPKQTPAVQSAFQRIIQNGQFEFVGGGWSQNDEVTTHWRDVVENQVLGHQWLRDTFGEHGRVRWGWQIDMFAGYASTTPALWAMMAYDGMVIRWEGRDVDMQASWTAEKAYQFRWQPSKVLSPNRSEMFCHIINGNYGDLVPQNSYVAGWGCDAKDLARGKCKHPAVNASNVGVVATALAALLQQKSLPYRSGPFMYPWGRDFFFVEANHAFGNMSLVLDEIRAYPVKYGLTVRLATLSEYFVHLHTLKDTLDFPVKKHNQAQFEWGWPKIVHEKGRYPFNYSNSSIQFQTGALTSRSRHKQYAREVAVSAHGAAIVHSLATVAPAHNLSINESMTLMSALLDSSGALAICQHHDSMPGTMEPSVLKDYTRMLDEGSASAGLVLVHSLGALTSSKSLGASNTEPRPHDNSKYSVLVFNPLTHTRTTVAKIKVPSDIAFPHNCTQYPDCAGHVFSVVGSGGVDVPAQYDIDGSVVHFVATVPALGFATFRFVSWEPRGVRPSYIAQPLVEKGAQDMNNSVLSLEFTSGALSQICERRSGVCARVNHELAVYKNGVGGAYLLIETEEAESVPHSQVQTVRGPVFSEVVQEHDGTGVVTSARQRVLIFHYGDQQDVIQVTQEIGVLDVYRELISRLSTDLDDVVLETDSTGMEMHCREQDSRGVGSNYHAMVQSASLSEGSGQFRSLAVLTTHTMGVASLKSGQIEYMLSRRLNTTDNQGPAPLDETEPINVTVALLFGTSTSVDGLRLRRALEREHPVVVLPVTAPLQRTGFAPLVEHVHPDAFLLGLSVRRGGTTGAGKVPTLSGVLSLVVRWMNTAPGGPAISVPLLLLIQSLAGPADVSRLTCAELTLSLLDRRSIAEARRLHWAPENETAATRTRARATVGDDACYDSVLIDPLDIRTFEVTWPQQ
jgi:hypothetical protein